MTDNKDMGPLGVIAGVGLAAGAAAFAAFLSNRHSGKYDDAPDRAARKNQGDLELVGRTVTIGKPRAELYAFWRDFSNLPGFMKNLLSVTPVDGAKDRSVWTIRAPAGQTVDIETEVTEDRENEKIAWASVEGSDMTTKGSVTFTDAPGERGTRVALVIEYDPPVGAVGKVIAQAFLREPKIQARHDLKRFRMMMETGEVATSARTKAQVDHPVEENAA